MTTNNMPNKNIDLPSQRAKLLMEIEKPLRRKFRSERTVPTWLLLLAAVWILTLTYLVLANIVDNQARQALELKKAEAAEVSPLCARYKADSALTGTASEITLKQICHD